MQYINSLYKKSLRIVPAITASLLIVGCATPSAESIGLEQGYLCCNMRTDGSWISDINYMESGKRVVPFGTPVKFVGFGRYRVNIEIDGKRQSIGNDYSRELAMEEFAKRYIVKENPRTKIATAPAAIRKAIESSRVTRGMTREQVIIAIGYPITSENPQLDTQSWKFWLWSFSPFEVYFGDDDRVTKVTGDEETLRMVYLQ